MVYKFALMFEEFVSPSSRETVFLRADFLGSPFTAAIYAKRERERQKKAT